MLNILWPAFLVVSIGFAIFSGNLKELNNSIFESTNLAVSLCITLLGTMCLWNGIMQIAGKNVSNEEDYQLFEAVDEMVVSEFE